MRNVSHFLVICLLSLATYVDFIPIFFFPFLVLCFFSFQEQLFASIAKGDLNKLIALLRKHPQCVSATEEVSE